MNLHTKLEHMKHLPRSHFRKCIGQMGPLGFFGRSYGGKDGLWALVPDRARLSKLGHISKSLRAPGYLSVRGEK